MPALLADAASIATAAICAGIRFNAHPTVVFGAPPKRPRRDRLSDARTPFMPVHFTVRQQCRLLSSTHGRLCSGTDLAVINDN